MMFEIHMLKSFPPTNLNRDDTGAPKSCVFGGVQRGRISSQCLKRSWRRSEVFEDSPIGKLGIRTQRLPLLIGEELKKRGLQEEYVNEVISKLSSLGLSGKEDTENENTEVVKTKERKKPKKIGFTNQIMFYTVQEIEKIADFFEKNKHKKWGEKLDDELKKEIEDIGCSLDIALFGRMATTKVFDNVSASMQVAHAISTNSLTPESDYFTAVDDLVKGGESDDAGAAIIGDIEYNASCYYIYACIDVDQLRENLKNAEDADALVRAAIPAVIEAMAYSNPSGKQNTFAGHVLPEVIMIEEKQRKVPVNYANAFIVPASMGGGRSLIADSAQKLAHEVDTIDRKYGLEVKERLWFALDDGEKPEKATECSTFAELIGSVAKAVE